MTAGSLLSTTEAQVRKVLSVIPRRKLVAPISIAPALHPIEAAVQSERTAAQNQPREAYIRPAGKSKLCKVLALVDGVALEALVDKRISGNHEWTIGDVSNLCQQLRCEIKDGRVWHHGSFRIEQELDETEQLVVRTLQKLGGVAHRQTLLESVPKEVAARIEATLGANPCVRRVGQCLYSLIGTQVAPATIEALGESGQTAEGKIFARLRIAPDMSNYETIVRSHGLPDGRYVTTQGHQIHMEGSRITGLKPLIGEAATGTLKLVVDPTTQEATEVVEPSFPELGARWLTGSKRAV